MQEIIQNSIRINILKKLMNYNYLTFTDLLGNEKSSLFNYHLKFLLDKDYIKKDEKRYELTDKGKDTCLFLDDNQLVRIIDKELKRRGLIISSATREEILKQQGIIISNKIAISIYDNRLWISKNSSDTMDKQFKEKCRINKVPKNIRAYLYSIGFVSFDDI